MKKKTIEALLEQAVSEGIIEIQCPECGATILGGGEWKHPAPAEGRCVFAFEKTQPLCLEVHLHTVVLQNSFILQIRFCFSKEFTVFHSLVPSLLDLFCRQKIRLARGKSKTSCLPFGSTVSYPGKLLSRPPRGQSKRVHPWYRIKLFVGFPLKFLIHC